MSTSDPAFDWTLELDGAPERLQTHLLRIFGDVDKCNEFAHRLLQHRPALLAGLPIFESCLKNPHDRQEWMNDLRDNTLHLWTSRPISSTDPLGIMLQTYWGRPQRSSPNSAQVQALLAQGLRSIVEIQEYSHPEQRRLFVYQVSTYAKLVQCLDQLPFDQMQYAWNGSYISMLTERDIDRERALVQARMIELSTRLQWSSSDWVSTTLEAIRSYIIHGCSWDMFDEGQITLFNRLNYMLSTRDTFDIAERVKIMENAFTVYSKWLRDNRHLLEFEESWTLRRIIGGVPVDRPFNRADSYTGMELAVQALNATGAPVAKTVVLVGTDDDEEYESDFEPESSVRSERTSVLSSGMSMMNAIQSSPRPVQNENENRMEEDNDNDQEILPDPEPEHDEWEQFVEEQHAPPPPDSQFSHYLPKYLKQLVDPDTNARFGWKNNTRYPDEFKLRDPDRTNSIDPHLTCFDQLMYDDQRLISWFHQDSNNIVILTPPTKDERWGTQAFCYSRELIASYVNSSTSVFIDCQDRDGNRIKDGTGGIDVNNPSLQAVKLPFGEGVNHYITLKDAEYMLRAKDIHIFQLRNTNIRWERTASDEAVKGSWVSANHCQAGTNIGITRVRGVRVIKDREPRSGDVVHTRRMSV